MGAVGGEEEGPPRSTPASIIRSCFKPGSGVITGAVD